MFAGASLLCFGSAFGLKVREEKLNKQLELVRERQARVAFENDNDDSFKPA